MPSLLWERSLQRKVTNVCNLAQRFPAAYTFIWVLLTLPTIHPGCGERSLLNLGRFSSPTQTSDTVRPGCRGRVQRPGRAKRGLLVLALGRSGHHVAACQPAYMSASCHQRAGLCGGRRGLGPHCAPLKVLGSPSVTDRQFGHH